MRSFRISSRRAGRIATTAALLVATIVPSFAPALASAAQITDRSVALSSSSVNATGVSYLFTFTADNASAGGIAVEFCSNTPLVGEACTAPGNGFTVNPSNNGNVTGGTKYGTWTANRACITKSVASGVNTFTLTGATNPSVASTLYARVVTYDTDAHAAAYGTPDSTTLGTGVIDQGSVAFAITNNVEVSGAVLEALTFCVSGDDIEADPDCANATAPVLTLGKDVGGGVIALDNTLSTGDVFTKISTNAVKGAVVSLKSTAGVNQPGNVPCAGLALYGTGACNIVAAGTGANTVAAGDAKFGVRLTLPTDNVTDGTIAAATNYSTSLYHLDDTAVIGTYGDPIYNTSGGSANNLNTTLTFAASSNAATPAGRYSANISLIATGTF